MAHHNTPISKPNISDMREAIKTIIVGNRRTEAGRLHNILSAYCPQVAVSGIAFSMIEAEKLVSRTNPGLAFMEMDFQDKDSRLLTKLSALDCNIIFTAPEQQYTLNQVPEVAIDCLHYHADIKDVTNAVSRALQMQWLKQQVHKINTPSLQTIALSNLNEIQFVHPQHIIRLEASNNYTNFFLDDGSKITVSHTLKHYEDSLAAHGFVRVHQSHIININKIRKYVKGKGGYVIMQDGECINISPNRKEHLFKSLNIT